MFLFGGTKFSGVGIFQYSTSTPVVFVSCTSPNPSDTGHNACLRSPSTPSKLYSTIVVPWACPYFLVPHFKNSFLWLILSSAQNSYTCQGWHYWGWYYEILFHLGLLNISVWYWQHWRCHFISQNSRHRLLSPVDCYCVLLSWWLWWVDGNARGTPNFEACRAHGFCSPVVGRVGLRIPFDSPWVAWSPKACVLQTRTILGPWPIAKPIYCFTQ